MSDTLLSVQGLQVLFTTHAGKVQAVRGVDFDVAAGEALGIVGESGSGKSVTVMSITRLLPDNGRIVAGNVVFKGRELTAASRRELKQIRGRHIAMIFQDPMSSLNPLISVGEQVREMIALHTSISRNESRNKVLELFEHVKIPDPVKRYGSFPHEFSGGMRQRIMIAMALACSPDLVIADEPTTALDVTIQAQILNLLAQLQKELGMSVIFITHDLGVVAGLCDRILVMYGGLVMEQGTARDIFHRPAHPYTQGLLHSVPRLDQDKSRRLSPIPGSPPDMLSPPPGCPFAPRCAHARQVCAQLPPPFFHLSLQHSSRCWLLSPEAPETDNPFAGVRQEVSP